ncbi:MAG: hypothetical protein IT457_03380 [Planctomycetes bacterium]|nr:hypothetical protein [Planctomycetota bacterium]
MKSEEDILFQAGSTTGAQFARNAPPPKEFAAAIAGLDLEAAIGGPATGSVATANTKPRAKGATEPPVSFEPRQAPAAATAPKPKLQDVAKRVQHGPVAIDSERTKQLEAKPSFFARLVELLFGWMRRD